MIALRKYFRLLPAVVIVGTGLLVLKGVDIARAAQAVTASPDEPDNSGLAPTDNGGAPASRDFADGDGTIASAAEVDVLSSLTQRRTELDARERALNMRENLLTAGEARVDQKIAALKDLQGQIQTLLAERDDKQKAQIASLVKSYGPDGMAAKKAAAIFNTMPDEVLLPIAKAMKPADLGPILAAMNPDAAQKLTVKLATLLKLPDTTTCPATAADLTTPGSAAPLQTAALSPPGATPVVSALPQPTATPPAATPAAAPPPAAVPPAPKPARPAPRVAKVAAPATVKPTTPVATPPAKPTPSSATPPAKPETASAPPPATAAAPPAAPPPAKPQAANGPPAPLAPGG